MESKQRRTSVYMTLTIEQNGVEIVGTHRCTAFVLQELSGFFWCSSCFSAFTINIVCRQNYPRIICGQQQAEYHGRFYLVQIVSTASFDQRSNNCT